MPILGVIASSTRQGLGPTDAGAMFPIFATTVTSTAASITFSNIPSTYKHLQIRGIARSNRANSSDTIFMWYNGDTGTNYGAHGLSSNGTSVSSYGASANTATQIDVMQIATTSSGSGVFGSFVIDILDYANTTKFKTQRSFGGFDNNGNGVLGLASGHWRNTNAITSITLDAHSTDTFQQFSTFALYGIL
jgi:hypothetical protein